MINLAGIGHVLLRVTDEEASKRFYCEILGFEVAQTPAAPWKCRRIVMARPDGPGARPAP